MTSRDPTDVYQTTWPLIVKLLNVDTTHCIHHGYYDKGIRTHHQAVQRMNDLVGQLLGLHTTTITTVLDAGCGVGGTVLHLAKKHPTIHFTGITTIPEHITTAQHLAEEHHVEHNTTFHQQDFMHTSFPDHSFDAVYLIEAACYAPNTQLLLRELFRILRPGGSLLCIDCFRTTTPLSHFLSISNRLFCTAWGLPSLSSLADFQNALHTEGFHDITTKDLSKNVQLSILREDVLSIPYLLPLIIRKLIKAKHYSLQDDPSFFTTAALQITLLGLAHKITYNAVTAKKRK